MSRYAILRVMLKRSAMVLFIFLCSALIHTLAPLLFSDNTGSGLFARTSAFADDGGGDGGDGGDGSGDGGDDGGDDGGSGSSSGSGGGDSQWQQDKRRKAIRARQRASKQARPSFIKHQILALDLTDQDIEKLRPLGFSVIRQDRLSAINMNITALKTPTRLSTPAALLLFKQQIPEKTSDLNHIYRTSARKCQFLDCLLKPFKIKASQKNRKKWRKKHYTAQTGGKTGPLTQLKHAPCEQGGCYGSEMIKWTTSHRKCRADFAIGVIDTDVDHNHIHLQGQNIETASFITGETKSSDPHGTAIVSLIAGNEKTSLQGLLPKMSVYAAGVFEPAQGEASVSTSLNIVKAMEWLGTKNVKILNMSLAGPHNIVLEKTVQDLQKKGIIIVAAAGNEGFQAKASYPAAYPDVIAVTAIDKNRRIYRGASRGPYIQFAAPGVDIWAAAPNNSFASYTGTSFAVPYVTSILAIMAKHDNTLFKQKLTEKFQIEDLGQRGPDKTYGAGLLLASKGCE